MPKSKSDNGKRLTKREFERLVKKAAQPSPKQPKESDSAESQTSEPHRPDDSSEKRKS